MGLVSTKYNCMFVHIPKTAGSSIIETITGKIKGQSPGLPHATLTELCHLTPGNESMFKLAIVRNPYIRLVSHFIYDVMDFLELLPETRDYMPTDPIALSVLHRKASSTKFREWLRGDSIHTFEKPPSMVEFALSDTAKLDYIGRIEDLETIWKYIQERTGLAAPLLHENGDTPRVDYTKYYNQEAKDVVKHIYKDDFIEFGYKW